MNKTILVAEDSAAIRKFIALAIKLMGHNVITAEDGMVALEKLPAQKIDMLITDLNMPNIDGIKLIKSLRDDREYKDIPIIILSSLTKEEDKNLGLAAGADSFLIKPFKMDKIQTEVAKYFR